MVGETRICFKEKSVTLCIQNDGGSGQSLTRPPPLQPPRGSNVSASKILDILLDFQMIGNIYNSKINTPVGQGRGGDGVGVIPRIADDLVSVNTSLF